MIESPEVLRKLKEGMSSTFDERIKKAELDESLSKVRKSSVKCLKNLFESVSANLYDTKKGKKFIKEYIETIKGNKELLKAYSLCESVENAVFDADEAHFFISESMKEYKINDKGIFNEGKNNLSWLVCRCIKEAKMNAEDVAKIMSENENVGNSIEYIILEEGKKNVSLLAENMANVYKQLINKEVGIKEECELDESISSMANDLKSLDMSGLNEWETKVVNDISTYTLRNKTKRDLFEDYKAACMEKLESICEDTESVEEKSRFKTMSEKIESKSFSEETINEDLLKFSELIYTLED